MSDQPKAVVDESAVVPATPTPTTAAPASVAPKPSLIDEYELGDTGHDPELDLPVSGVAPPKPVSVESDNADAATPRDAQGRFIKTEAKPAHSPFLVKQAQDLGITDAEIAEMEGDVLQQTVYYTNRQRLTAAPRAESKPEAPKAATLEDLGINEADYDPALVKVLKGMHARLQQYEQREVRRENETNSQTIDRVFAAHEAILGKGTVNDIDKTTPEYQRRIAAVRMAHDDNSKDSLEKKIERAVKTLWPDAPKAPEAKEPEAPAAAPKNGKTITVDQWNRAGLARPTQREGAQEPKGEKRAVKAVARMMREQGTVDEFDGNEEDGLPG